MMNIDKLITQHLKACPPEKIPLIVVVGPTASGKTRLSICLSHKFNGEVISADSRQVYKKMDIGTDKISPIQMQGVPHHLLDVVEPHENFSLAQYVDVANHAVKEIYQRGKIPFLVGGTGLYINAITQNYDLPRIPPNIQLREKYETVAQKEGNNAVHDYLASIDPESAAKIHPNNLRYLIRAIEVYEALKQSKEKFTVKESSYHTLKLAINWPRELLYSRINKRVEEQVENGIITELKELLKICPREASSMSSLGYKEYFPYLDGEISLEEAVKQLQQNTRNYAKRQLTWFRKDPEIHWLEGAALEEYTSAN